MRGIGILCSPRLYTSQRTNAREAVANGAETKNDLLGVKNGEKRKGCEALKSQRVMQPARYTCIAVA